MTLLADVVTASSEIAETNSRSRKIAILAELLRKLDTDEIPIAVGFLSGGPHQGRVGVGYSIAYGIESTAAAEASLTVEDVDRAITAVQRAIGSGSSTRRRQILGDLFSRATERETDFIRRLFTGELRQGSLAGLMLDAISGAAGVPGQIVRRAVMLSGDLPRTAAIAMTAGEKGLRDVGLEIFRPVLPMLASTAASVAEAVAGFGLASVEWKLDGIRIQVHRRDDTVRIYTRNLNDITESLGGIAEEVRRLPIREAVLDGEALWMMEDGPASFQETAARLDREAPPEGIVTFLF
ncbi:MAG: ATP-dependent DNA ligase, partial [Actinomycetota bacterium]